MTHGIDTDFLAWLAGYQLGRKRLRDTLLAATFFRAGVRRIITNNEKVFPGSRRIRVCQLPFLSGLAMAIVEPDGVGADEDF